MASQLAHYDIYREELAKAYPGFGYALWEPGPGEQNPHVEVGDVGFIREGQFNRLFNALLPGEHESHERFGVPEGHEPLRLTVTDHINRRVLTPNTFRSHGVTVLSGGLEILAATTVGSAEASFSCTRKHGAVLSLPVTARCENTLTRGHFRKWIIKHIDSWLAFTNMHGLELEMEDIVLVTGCHRTRSWSNIAFNEFQADAHFSLGVEVAGALGARIHWRASSVRVQGAMLSQGPSGENLPENQCIFVRGFRVKRKLWGLFPRVEGAAEPKPHLPGNDREPEKEVESIPSGTEYRDPLHVLLQHIENRMPDCDMVLVHDDDLEQILGVDDGTSLETLQPDVVMNHLERSQPEIGIMSDALPFDNLNPGIDTKHMRVAMLSEHLKERPPSVPPLSHLPVDSTNRDESHSAQSDILATVTSYPSELALPTAFQGAFSEPDVHGSDDLPKHRPSEDPAHTLLLFDDGPWTVSAPPPSWSNPRDDDRWDLRFMEIDRREPSDSVSSAATLVRGVTPPIDFTKLVVPPPFERAASTVTQTMTRKRPASVFDGVAPPTRKRKTTSMPAQTSHRPAPPPESVTSAGEEEAEAPPLTSETLEPKHIPAITFDELTITLKEQNKRIEELIQDNIHLRDEFVNLSRTFQMSKSDLERVENTIPKLAVELKTKFEKMLEKTEDRIQGPIDRLLEELGRLRANPTPAHISGITTFPQGTQFVPESQTEGEGSWVPPEDYNPPEPSYREPLLQPSQNNNSGTGTSSHQSWGPGSSSRGGGGVRPPASAPATTPAPASTSAPVPAPAPVSATISSPRHSDSYHSRGGPPPSQKSHTHLHAHPEHCDDEPPTPPGSRTPTPKRIHGATAKAGPEAGARGRVRRQK